MACKICDQPHVLAAMLLSEHCVLCTYISAFHKVRKTGYQYPEFGPKPGEIPKKNLQKDTLAFKKGWVTCTSGCGLTLGPPMVRFGRMAGESTQNCKKEVKEGKGQGISGAKACPFEWQEVQKGVLHIGSIGNGRLGESSRALIKGGPHSFSKAFEVHKSNHRRGGRGGNGDG